MTTPKDVSGESLTALIGRLEKATKPDRDIDAEIMAVLFRREHRHIGTTEGPEDGPYEPVTDEVWVDPATDRWVSTHAREYTASIDVALTLLQERWHLKVLHSGDKGLKYDRTYAEICPNNDYDGGWKVGVVVGYGFNEATSIAVAAIKARLASFLQGHKALLPRTRRSG